MKQYNSGMLYHLYLAEVYQALQGIKLGGVPKFRYFKIYHIPFLRHTLKLKLTPNTRFDIL